MAEKFSKMIKKKRTLWEQEKLLVTSNFSFPHSVFKRLILQAHKHKGLFGKRLELIPNDKILVCSKLKALADDEEDTMQPFTKQVFGRDRFPSVCR